MPVWEANVFVPIMSSFRAVAPASVLLSAFSAETVSRPFVTDGTANPLVILPVTRPLVNASAAVIVSKPLVIAVVGSPFVIVTAARVFVSVMFNFSSVAPANVLLVVVRRLVEANAPAAVIVSKSLVIAVVGRPLVIASVAAANVLLIVPTRFVSAGYGRLIASHTSPVAPDGATCTTLEPEPNS